MALLGQRLESAEAAEDLTGQIAMDDVVPAYETAIRSGRVSLDQLIEARLGATAPTETAPARAVHPSYFPRLLQVYVKEHGSIEESYFCKRIRGAAILTQSERKKSFGRKEVTLRIHLRYPPEAVVRVTPDFEEALWKCMALSKKATQLLRTQNSRMLHKVMHSTVVYLLSVLDSVEGESDEKKTQKTQQAVNQAHSELDEAQRQYRQCASWGAQLAYSKGLLLGMLFLMALGAAVTLGVWALGDGRLAYPVLQHLLLCLLAGGLGAIVSVMYRMTSGKLRPNHYTEHKSLGMLASFRPVIGAIFATAIYVLIWGGFLTMKPPDASNAYYFVAGVAFLSGFSERFAQVSLAGAMKPGVEGQTAEASPPVERKPARAQRTGLLSQAKPSTS
ncbi:MAG TPA: hypothetical protein VHJ78_05260 [Actinomycetota bacterium]|nr:hypothetical protein [Actinomycetota bacterium]